MFYDTDSNLKEQWKFNKADLLPGSVVRHGRALLNYQGDGDGSDLDKPLVFSPVNKRRGRQPFAKADPSMLNTSHKKSSLLKSRNAERKDLMVIRNKWDFLADSRQKRRNLKRKERNPKSRRKIAEKQHNATLDEDQFYCPSNLNKTEVNRLVNCIDALMHCSGVCRKFPPCNCQLTLPQYVHMLGCAALGKKIRHWTCFD